MGEHSKSKLMASKRHAILKIMLAFGTIPLDCNLEQRTDFRNLRSVLNDALIEYSILRSFYLDFVRLNRVDLQLRFVVDFSANSKSSGNRNPDPDAFLLNANATRAEGWRYLAVLSRGLYELHSYIRACIVLGNYEEAGWTVELDDVNNVDRSRAIEAKHALAEAAGDYLGRRTDLEKGKSIMATFRKESLPEMSLSIVHLLS